MKLVNHRLNQGGAFQVFILGLRVVQLAAIQRQGLFKVQNIFGVTIDLHPRRCLVNARRFIQINQRENEHRDESGDNQPTPFEDYMPIVA